jgi:SLT domain-containing protein
MATQISSLANLMGGSGANALTPVSSQAIDSGTGSGGTGLGGILGSGSFGGSAQDGLGQVNNGASTIASAINTASNALGGGGQSGRPEFRKGGSVKKGYTSGGKINLGACGVSTSSKGKKNSGW